MGIFMILDRSFKCLNLMFIFMLSGMAFSDVNFQLPQSNGSENYNQYLTKIGIADIGRDRDCKDCDKYLFVGNSKFPLDEDHSVLATARYINSGYAFYRDKKKYYVASQGTRKEITSKAIKRNCNRRTSLAIGVTRKGLAACLMKDALYVDGKVYDLPVKAVSGHIGSYYNGGATLAYVGTDKRIYIGFYDKYTAIDIGLNSNSDIKDILSVQKVAGYTYLAAYIYTNKLNKSLKVFKLGKNENGHFEYFNSKLISNSTEDDTGLNPSIYIDNHKIAVIHSKTRSNLTRWELPVSNIDSVDSYLSPWPEKDVLSFLASYGVRQTQWVIDQEIPDFGDASSNIGRTRYTMNEGVLQEYKLDGKLYNTSLTITLVKNKVEQGANQLEKAATNRIFGSLGISDLFDGPQTLRLEYANDKTGGVAEYTLNEVTEYYEFKTEQKSYSVLVSGEQGGYAGLKYSENAIPSLLGFFSTGSSGDRVEFDEGFTIKKLGLVSGFSEAQYGRRYLFNYSKVYLSGNIGVGVYESILSDEIKSKITSDTGKSIRTNYGLTADFRLELGYIIQRRSKSLQGFGGSLQLAYAYDLDWYMNSTPKKRNKIDDDELVSGFERTDHRHGPIIRFNLIF